MCVHVDYFKIANESTVLLLVHAHTHSLCFFSVCIEN